MAATKSQRTYRVESAPIPGVCVVVITTPQATGRYTVIRRTADVVGFRQDGSDLEYQADTWNHTCTCLAGQHGRRCKHHDLAVVLTKESVV